MTKKISLIILSIILAVILCLGVLAFLPDALAWGAYEEYHAAKNLIQKGTDIGNVAYATYNVDKGELTDAEFASAKNDAVKILSRRFADIYGYYNCAIRYNDDGELYIAIPETTSHERDDAEDIISGIAKKGLIEICSGTSYDADSVIMSMADEEATFKNASVSQYVNGGNTFYITQVNLTNAGISVAASKFTGGTSSASGYCYIDGSYIGYLYYSSGSTYAQIYAQNSINAKIISECINKGALAFSISQTDYDVAVKSAPVALIVGIVILALVVALCVFFIVRYRLLGFAYTISVVAAIVTTVYFSGLVYFSVLNISAIIGFILGLALMSYLTYFSFEKIKVNLEKGKSPEIAAKTAFNSSWKRTLLISGIALVFGIIMWVIPTAVTAYFGNALVYSVIASAGVTLGLNRLFVYLLK